MKNALSYQSLPKKQSFIGRCNRSGLISFRSVRLLFIAAAIFIFQCVPHSLSADDISKVLILHSYHKQFPWTDNIMEGIHSVFDKSDIDVEMHVEYMDVKRHSPDESFDYLFNLYTFRYRHTRFDAIILSDDFALEFILKYRSTLFPGVPIVFCGINNFDESERLKYNDITGVVEDIDLIGTIALGVAMHPETKQVAVINDGSLPARVMMQKARNAMSYFDQLTLIELFDLSVSKLTETLGRLPDNTIILHIHYYSDKETGKSLTVQQSFGITRGNTHLPIYTGWDFQIGYGATGGIVTNGKVQGRVAAKMALRILKGASPNSIPPLVDSPNTPMFDYNYMGRFGISVNDLPEESIILNEPISLYYQYKPQILLTIVFFIILLCFNVVLIINIVLRKRTEKVLKKSMEQQSAYKEQLLQAHKMESIGTLAGGIAHDFNNILSAIIGFTELSLEDAEKGSMMESNLKEVLSGSIRARDLVSQILTFARKAKQELKPIQIHTIATDAVKLIRSSIPTTISIEQDIDSTSFILGNSTQIHQVFMNLCTNAAHAMDEKGGVLKISIHDVDLKIVSTVSNLGLKPGEHIKIKVSDTGSGIKPEHIQSIFEPYFTTKDVGEGSGIGLSVVHGIIESCGGKIFAESQLGIGTVFIIYLPIAPTSQHPLEGEDVKSTINKVNLIPVGHDGAIIDSHR